MSDDIFCDPPVRNLPQWDGRWGGLKLHDEETWGASGCHPSSIAMVLRWYAEDNPSTKGTFAFPEKSGSSVPHDHYGRRMAEAFWPDLGGKVNAINNNVDHDGLLRKAAAALGMQPDEKGRFGAVLLSMGGNRLETIKNALKTGPIVVNMTHPGHFVVIHGYKDGKLLVSDPGNCIANHWEGSVVGAGRPTQDQWPGGGPPSHGNEYGASAYVALDPTRSYSIKGSDLSINFVSSLIRMELYTCAAGAAAQPGEKPAAAPPTTPAKPASSGPDHPPGYGGNTQHEVTPRAEAYAEGDYTKVPIQVGAASVDAGLSRPTKGTQVLWGGSAPASPWGHLLALIDKAGGEVNYTYLHGAVLAQSAVAIHGAIKGTKPPEKEPPPAPVTGGTPNVPPPPPVWTNPAGDIAPISTGLAVFADPADAIFWPIRTKTSFGRKVSYIGEGGQDFGNGSRHFLANRSSGRAHVGIDLYGDYGDVVVAIEPGTIKNWYFFYEGVYALFVECDSGLVINYGEVDGGSMKEFKLKVGDKVTAGQPIAKVGKMTSGSHMLHLEMYPKGTGQNEKHYFKSGDADLGKWRNPSQYLLALAKIGK